MRGALVAGTNGKGSVLALAGSALRAAGLRVGETPKPHLVSYRERIVVDGRPIDAAEFARLVAEVVPAADRVARRHGPPTEFELLTAIVFRHFADVGLDLAIVEVGLGGRLDATHAWDGGVAAITNVDLDHMDRLGPTIPLIAREKAAIIERGDLAVTGATGEALAVVRRRAGRMGVPLTVVEPAPILATDRDGLTVELPRLGRTRVGLLGRHQAANVAVADAVLDALEAAGIARVGDDARRAGYAGATWPGRMELLTSGDRDVLLDGAHNPAGAAALAVALDDLRPHLTAGPVTLVTASMADKDVDGVIAALAASPSPRGRAGHRDDPGPAPRHARRRAGRPLARGAPRWAGTEPSPRTRAPPSTGRWVARAARSSWPARSILSGPSAPGWSTTRCCATRPTRPDDPRRARPDPTRRPRAGRSSRRPSVRPSSRGAPART